MEPRKRCEKDAGLRVTWAEPGAQHRVPGAVGGCSLGRCLSRARWANMAGRSNIPVCVCGVGGGGDEPKVSFILN